MSPLRVQNRVAYLDRTLNDWHRIAFSKECTAIDLDLVGVCQYSSCREWLYLLEGTRDPNKHTNIVRSGSRQMGVSSYCVRLGTQRPVGAALIWAPLDMAHLPKAVVGEQAVKDLFTLIRKIHNEKKHPKGF